MQIGAISPIMCAWYISRGPDMVDTSLSAGAQPAEQAKAIGELLNQAGVLAIHLSGNPGSGKTTLIEATLKRLSPQAQVAVIIGHMAAGRDAATLQRAGARAIALECAAISPAMVRDAIQSLMLAPRRMDLLLIEDNGQPIEFQQGQAGPCVCVAVFSVPCGDGKAAEFPHRIRNAELVLLTKTDLLPHVRYDLEVFRADVKRANPKARIIELSCTEGKGMDEWVDWLLARSLQARANRHAQSQPANPECWVG